MTADNMVQLSRDLNLKSKHELVMWSALETYTTKAYNFVGKGLFVSMRERKPTCSQLKPNKHEYVKKES